MDNELRRDLTAYFCKGLSDCRVDYEHLGEKATQSGVSYPKYYLWVKCFVKGKLRTQGAARVAAIDQHYFQVMNFLSDDEIQAAPDQIESVFPAALVDTIRKKAGR